MEIWSGLFSCPPAAGAAEIIIVCPTKIFILAVNEETAQVIQAAFQHARYPDITGKRSVPLIGRAQYTLEK